MLTLIVIALFSYVGKSAAVCGYEVECPGGYLYNPHSSTCYRVVNQTKTWDDAKAYCEGAGERLAVFDSLESISWGRHMRKTRSDRLFIEWTPYINKDVWIGGRKYPGGWRWMNNFGRLVVVEDWFIGQPDNREGFEDCLAFSASYNQDLRWSDQTCTYSYYSICEKY